jgi:peptidyl-prolyl cis-trans isomerase A (cyclophilin A)
MRRVDNGTRVPSLVSTRIRWCACALLFAACQAPPPPKDRAEPARFAVESDVANAAGSAKDDGAKDAKPEAPPAPPVAAEVKAPDDEAAPPRERDKRLLDPILANETAPERFTVLLDTTAGPIHLDLRRSWAPRGVDRFYNLVRIGFFDGASFFRVVPGFVAQVGIAADPAVSRAWRTQRIADDPVTQTNVSGMVSFATSGKNSRTTQLFINLADNTRLDAMGFAPIGRIRELDVARKLYSGYGEAPVQARIEREGDGYLRAQFPKLDAIKRATIADERPVRIR